ncbi:uncharacterized protein TNCT_684211 [Trichonephila clavata]|uniref:Uncharacterized protein n=1 Tax=Trichonephila clavata TaxID=2740835 RepID=A0A8X6FPX0_TRICU|nr:uncharacterized protein TNCT_684211 [Trichonephila clavata]
MLNLGVSKAKNRFLIKKMSVDSAIENKTVLNRFPIFSVHIFTPVSRKLRETFEETLTLPENIYFIVKQIPVTVFIEEPFITQFIKTGSLHAFSHNTKVDMENFIALLPSGELILYLENEIAETLALKKDHIPQNNVKKRKPNFQTCKIETKLPNFRRGEKLYDLVHNELTKLKDMKFDVLLKWKPEGNICPQSIRCYFEKEGYECITCEPSYTNTTNFSIPVPNINLKQFDFSKIEDIMEWIGLQICNISDFPGGVDIGNVFLMQQEESSHIENLKIDFFQGFFEGDQVCSILKKSKKLFEENPEMQFIIVFISGYSESYISRKKFEKFSSGDKSTTLIISADLVYSVTSL